MSGFTLGNATGATLGNATGGTLGESFAEYLLDGQLLPAYHTEVATHDSLTLGFRVTTRTLLKVLRQAKNDQNKVTVLQADDGGYAAVGRADGANTFTLTPPKVRRPLRQEGTYHVVRYEESLVSQTVEEWEVEIEFVPASNRTDQGSIGLQEQQAFTGGDAGATLGNATGFTLGNSTGASLGNTRVGVPQDWWGIDTRYGEIATDRVDAEFLGTGADGVERFEVTMRLTFDQAYVFETALARLDGVRVRSLVDATNAAVDDTATGANTVAIDSPTESVVENGDYVVMAWESTRINEAYQTVSMEIARSG